MTPQTALVLPDVARLLDYARIQHAPSPEGFTLIEAVDPDRPQQTLLLLTLPQHPRPTRIDALFPRIEVREDDTGVSIHRHAWTPLRVRRRHWARTVTELIALRPDPDPAPPTMLLCMADHLNTLRDLIIDSLALGNFRMALASVGESVLLRIEAPSWFLIERTAEQDGVAMYGPLPAGHNQLWQAWGWQHPLAAFWQTSSPPLGTGWLLFRPGQPALQLAEPSWQDIYDVADIRLDFDSTSISLQSGTVEERFEVPIRMTPRARPAEPELWLIEASERAVLDQMLLSLDESDLEDLLIATVQDPEGGPTRFFLRERRAGQGLRLLPPGLRGFAPWQGLSNLFLPADQALEPRLRRDRYIQLFGLQGGTLTVLNHPAPSAPMEHLQLSSADFVPLERLVDFLLAPHATRLQSIQAESLFDVTPYNRAPSRPSARPASSHKTPRPQPSPQQAAPSSPRSERPSVAPAPMPQVTSIPERTPIAVKLSALMAQEQTLERAIIRQPTASSWHELALIKQQLNRPMEAIRCAIEAWWLTEDYSDTDAWEALTDLQRQHLQLSGSPTQRIRQISKNQDVASNLAYAFLSRPLSARRVPGWLQEAAKRLEHSTPHLSKKERWLAWGELWRHNQDVRGQARLRESILQALDADGTDMLDTPSFIRSRLLTDRGLEGDTASNTEHSLATSHLKAIEDTVQGLPQPFRGGGMAVLGRLWLRLNQPERSTQCFERATRATTSVAQCWLHLQSREALASSAADRALTHDRLMRQRFARYPQFIAARFQDLERTFRQRREGQAADNFLSKERLQLLFPTLSGMDYNTDLLRRQLERAQAYRKEGQTDGFELGMRAVLKGVEQHHTTIDMRVLSRMLFETCRELAVHDKLSQLSAASNQPSGLVKRFKDVAYVLLKFSKTSADTDFFTIIMEASLARCLIDLQSEKQGLKGLAQARQHLFQADLVSMDFVDCCTSILSAIEALPLNKRQGPIQQFLSTIGTRLPTLSDAALVTSQLNIFTMLDQLGEAAVSKDQLALTRFQQYQDLDEFLIRERILREDFCT